MNIFFIRIPLLLAPLLATSLNGQGKVEPPSTASDQIPALQITEVPKETKVIEEKGLFMNPALGASLQHSPTQSGNPSSNEELAPNPMAGKYLDAPSDRDTSLPNATRLFSFKLDPGESILIRRFTEEESGISMRLVQPTHQHALSPQILMINRKPQPLRSKRIEFKNTTNDSFKMLLLVYGRNGIPYKLEISRKP